MNNDINLNKRIGKFYISSKLLFDNYNLVNRILNNVVVVECTHHFYNNHFEYHAISHLFDVLEEGCQPNEYKVSITGDEIKFEKVDY